MLSSEISFLGGRNIHTPNIDRIAQEGISFNHCYASMAMSVPIRASMYTGLYPVRNGSYSNHRDTYYGTKTVNEYMPEEGYRVGRTGKDHPVTKDVYLFDEIPGFTVGCTNKTAAYSVDGIRKWVQEGQDPFLLYVCSINPHAPWTWGNPDEFDPDKLIMPENCVDSPEMRKIFCKYLAEIRALDIVGDYEFFTEKQPRLVTLTMLEDSLCLVIPAAEYMTWLRSDSHALFLRSRMIITQLVAQAQFQRQNLFADNRTRMLVFLKEQVTQAVNDSTHTENSNGNPNPGSVYPIRIPFTRPEIAAHLGCSVRTVNRTVQELVDEEIIHLNKGKIWISEKQASTFL